MKFFEIFRRPFHNSLSSRKISPSSRLSSTTASATAAANLTTSATTQRSKFYRQRTNLFPGQNKERSRTKRQAYGNFRSRYRGAGTTTTTTTTTTTQKPSHRIRGLKRKDSHTTFLPSRLPSTSSSGTRKYSSSTSGRRRLSYNSSGTGSSYSSSSTHNIGSSSSRTSRQRGPPTRGPTKRSRSKSRSQNVQEYDFAQNNDGKITVTYNVAKQTTIPVVNGKF